MPDSRLAEAIFAVHLAIIAFNVAGLVVIPVGAWLGWSIVRMAWLRLLHLGMLLIVTVQALAGRACVLTIWQNDLTGLRQPAQPMIMRWIERLVYWNLPPWGFAVMYSGVFLYVLALTVFVPFWTSKRK
ncbi:MAG TPA: DUF2784 domain-containing protein [Acidocella sp.]|jgi:hypothetical protein|uniref:DUF2784 domain-containing protein n=1 Tax=Acidocella sp. TaxID=50710 RepID=UPI002CB74F86|nr:DUF2784 domain-containing protein [Acidocella sp.]HVE22747.1 DUF2784 domain-containing protein [Acidocella sp.]